MNRATTNNRQHNPLFYVTTLPALIAVGFCLSLVDWVLQIYHKPRTRAVVVDRRRGKVLLVRNSTEPWRWNLPGGGYNRGESGPDCAARELHEETSLTVDSSQLTPLTRYTYRSPWRGVWELDCFVADIDSDTHPARAASFDVLEARWWSRDHLPARRADIISYCIDKIE